MNHIEPPKDKPRFLQKRNSYTGGGGASAARHTHRRFSSETTQGSRQTAQACTGGLRLQSIVNEQRAERPLHHANKKKICSHAFPGPRCATYAHDIIPPTESRHVMLSSSRQRICRKNKTQALGGAQRTGKKSKNCCHFIEQKKKKKYLEVPKGTSYPMVSTQAVSLLILILLFDCRRYGDASITRRVAAQPIFSVVHGLWLRSFTHTCSTPSIQQ